MNIFYYNGANANHFDEILPFIPREGFDTLVCRNKGLVSLRGICCIPACYKTVDFSQNNLKDFYEDLKGTCFTTLIVSNNNIRSLNGIEYSKIETLHIEGNKIFTLFPIEDSNVKKLYIENNKLVTLFGMEYSSVEELYAKNNCLSSIKFVGENVRIIDVAGNPVYQDYLSMLGEDEVFEIDKVVNFYNNEEIKKWGVVVC